MKRAGKVKSEDAPAYGADIVAGPGYPGYPEFTDDEIIACAILILEKRVRTGDVLSAPGDATKYLRLRLARYEREVFAVMFLDNRHRVIEFELLFFGTIDQATVHPREIVKRALYHNAAAVVLAHNHPSGNPEPSRADALLTTRIKEALALIDVRVLDHFVVGDGNPVSLAERGLV